MWVTVGPTCCAKLGRNVIDIKHVMTHFSTRNMPALAHKIGKWNVSFHPEIAHPIYQGLFSFVPTAVPFSIYRRVTNRPSLANNATIKNPLLVRLSDHTLYPHFLVTCPSQPFRTQRSSLGLIRMHFHPLSGKSARPRQRFIMAKSCPRYVVAPITSTASRSNRTQANEKCPVCGHLEAFYEEKQVRSPKVLRTPVLTPWTDAQRRRRIHDSLYGMSLSRTPHFFPSHPFQCVSCSHGWRINN